MHPQIAAMELDRGPAHVSKHFQIVFSSAAFVNKMIENKYVPVDSEYAKQLASPSCYAILTMVQWAAMVTKNYSYSSSLVHC